MRLVVAKRVSVGSCDITFLSCLLNIGQLVQKLTKAGRQKETNTQYDNIRLRVYFSF